jgi:hypothetical protein
MWVAYSTSGADDKRIMPFKTEPQNNKVEWYKNDIKSRFTLHVIDCTNLTPDTRVKVTLVARPLHTPLT